SLELIEDIFSNLDDASYFYTIRPLGWYEDMNALMMEEADIRPLKVFFHKPQVWINRKEQFRFKTFFEHTGRWLRIYHDHSGRVQEGVLFPKSLYDATQDKLQLIETASKLDLSFARKLLDDLHRKYGDKNVLYHVLHNNFSLNNVFVTQNEKICSFDPHNELGPLYSDLAK